MLRFLNAVFLDSMKILHKPHGAKTSDPVINTEDNDALMLADDKTLTESGIGMII